MTYSGGAEPASAPFAPRLAEPAGLPTLLADLVARARARQEARAHGARVSRLDLPRWLRDLFPSYVTAPFGPYHLELLDWIAGLESGQPADPFVAIWPRAGAKSTLAELCCAYLAAAGTRRYAFYVSRTQGQADGHVGNVATMLTSSAFAAAYPLASAAEVTTVGTRRAWNRSRLRTASRFTIDALGIDTAARGAKIDEDRPDLIIVDDIDRETDSPGTTAKLQHLLTRTILPAGADGFTALVLQNLVHPDSVISRLADGRADFLTQRRVSGPHRAIEGFAYRTGPRGVEILGGEPTWAGMGLDRCAQLIAKIGLNSFLVECQHEVERVLGGVYDEIDFDAITVPEEEIPWKRLSRVVVWVDPAITDKDDSDSCGIQCDGLDAATGLIYRLYSWEKRAGPVAALTHAIEIALELGADTVGVETDQGGDTWRTIFETAWEAIRGGSRVPPHRRPPEYAEAKAGSEHGSKVTRSRRMLTDYEHGRIRHGPRARPLTNSLRRFPKLKPHDLTDASYYAWRDLRGNEGGEDLADLAEQLVNYRGL